MVWTYAVAAVGCPTGGVLRAFTRLARTRRDESLHDGEDGGDSVNSDVPEQRREPANSNGYAPVIWLHNKNWTRDQEMRTHLGKGKEVRERWGRTPVVIKIELERRRPWWTPVRNSSSPEARFGKVGEGKWRGARGLFIESNDARFGGVIGPQSTRQVMAENFLLEVELRDYDIYVGNEFPEWDAHSIWSNFRVECGKKRSPN